MTKVIHCKRGPYDVYIGRRTPQIPGSIWGNPYVIGHDGTREEVIEKYRKYILAKPELLEKLETLRGKTLGCWCKPQACHGDVLVELLEAKPAAQAESLGPCVKCKKHYATLKSPSGAVYCQQCGRCQRRVYGAMQGIAVLREECNTSVDKFVKHPRLGIYVCPCLIKFEKEYEA